MNTQLRYRHDLGNDRWIVECVYPGLRDGYFIEAGATNGVNGSATYVLESDLGWKGLCVEPIPWQFAQVKKLRQCSADNRALWHTTGLKLDFVIFPNRTGRSGLSAVNKNATQMAEIGEESTVVVVETVTLQDALREHDAPNEIDYFCLDVEGAERELLTKFDFDGEFLIKCLSIEGHACDDLMLSAGYRRTNNPFTDATFETYWLHRSLTALQR